MPLQEQLGERLSGLEAKVEGMDRYAHDKWHDLNNTLQPLVNLPLQLTRDIAKMQGTFDGRIATISKEIERSITAAVEKAIEPVNADIAVLKTDVETLKAAKLQEDGARSVIATILKSPALGWLVGAAITGWAIVTGKVHI